LGCLQGHGGDESGCLGGRYKTNVAIHGINPLKHETGVTQETPRPETVLDLRGLNCPIPVLRAKKALRTIPVGGTLILECTDPLTVIDVPHFVNQTGHLLTTQEQRGKLYLFHIVKQK
jgi:tRNA 2-thiouridine synthesizing protein A